MINYEKPSLTKPSTLLPSLSRTGAIALHTGHDRPQEKRIPPSLFSRGREEAALFITAGALWAERGLCRGRGVRGLDRARRCGSPTPGDEPTTRRSTASSTASSSARNISTACTSDIDRPRRPRTRTSRPCPSLAAASRSRARPRRRRRRPPARRHTPGRVTWGADVFRGAATRETPAETPERAHLLRSRGVRDRHATAAPPAPSIASPVPWHRRDPAAGATPGFSPGTPDDLSAAPAPAYTPESQACPARRASGGAITCPAARRWRIRQRRGDASAVDGVLTRGDAPVHPHRP